MTRHRLDLKGSDRQDVGKAKTVLSLVNAALLRQHFPHCENKLVKNPPHTARAYENECCVLYLTLRQLKYIS